MHDPRNRYETALDRLFEHHGVVPTRHVLAASSPRPIHVVEHGQGDPLLFIHGGLSFGASYAALFPHLPGRRIICPDRPGHGLSYGIDYREVADFRADAAAYVLRVVDELGLEEVDLVANSMGGFFAASFALAHPDRVRRLLLLGAPAGADRWVPPMLRLMGLPVVGRILAALGGELDERKARDIHRQMLVVDASRPSDAYYACTEVAMNMPGSDLAIRTMLRSALDLRGWRNRYNLRAELAALDVPTLFAWGDRDAFAPPQSGRDLASRMPDARFVLLEDAGHLPWLDQPEATAAAMRGFLEETTQEVAESHGARALAQARSHG